MAKNDPTKEKILDEIKAIEERIKFDQIRLATLKSLIFVEQEVDKRPENFTLTKEIELVLMQRRGQYITVDFILEEIGRKWGGYKPKKNSVSATLSTWKKEGKVQKNEEGGVMLV